MAVPYGRKSKSKSRMQRAANMQYKSKPYSTCSKCKEPKIPYNICKKCGHYSDKLIITVKPQRHS